MMITLIFFSKLEHYTSDISDQHLIIAGDFNTILNPTLDKKKGKIKTHVKCRQKINSIMEENSLIDVWKSKNSEQLQYTWHSKVEERR